MKTTLLLIRHGETPWNALGKFQGSTNIDLSEAGIWQAKLIRERLNGDFDAVYSSPLNRALETARIICSSAAFTPIVKEDLTEIHFGTWEGLTYTQIKDTYPEHFTRWRTDEQIGPMYDGELSTQNASIRAKKCILDIAAGHMEQKIVVVSHGGFIKAALIGLFDWKMTMFHQMALGNTCLTTIQFKDDLSPILIGLNDTNHLADQTPFSI